MTTRRTLLIGLALAASGLTACSGEPTDNPTPVIATPTESGPAAHISVSADPTAAHNEADVAFARALLRHDQETLDLVKLAPSRASSLEVKQLAAEIELQQGPQRSELERWLLNRSQSVDSSANVKQAGTAKKLAALDGAAFDKAFLTAMVAHHEQGLALAATEMADGTEPATKALAARITTERKPQLERMRTLLAG